MLTVELGVINFKVELEKLVARHVVMPVKEPDQDNGNNYNNMENGERAIPVPKVGPLHWAAKEGHVDVTTFLLSNRPELDEAVTTREAEVGIPSEEKQTSRSCAWTSEESDEGKLQPDHNGGNNIISKGNRVSALRPICDFNFNNNAPKSLGNNMCMCKMFNIKISILIKCIISKY